MRNALEVSKGNRMPVWNMPDVDDMFERALRNPFSLFEDLRPAVMADTRWMQPNFDVEETDQAYLLSVDMPGVKKEDVKVDLTENILTVSGERKYEHESKGKGARRYERAYGQFQRSFTLPTSIDVDKVEANLEDGVLRVALPKSEQAKPRSIQIGSGKGSFFSKLIGSSKREEKADSKAQAH
ncbi:MAG TPA: Hsp20/alpha crystallin family protein [Pseudobdellovibrionaceae bacterium]|nr:Hsp20/alpha crystallin family protein [Pseudobdellovibrionaceae bacterium]